MKKMIYVILILIAFVSCVDMDLAPESNLNPETFFQSTADADAAVIGVYAGFQHNDIYNQFSEVLQSQGTDDAEWGEGRSTQNLDKNALDKFQFNESTNLVYAVWNRHYSTINRANFTIENVQKMSLEMISESSQKRIIGEAKFLRGLAYFNLVRIYGGVPLILKETVSLEGLDVSRNTLEECYTQIINDLSDAETSLPDKKDIPADYLGRATKGAAKGLLAKVYLTQKNYQKVIEKTEEVMSMGYSLWNNYADNFDVEKENGKESIFEIQYKRNTPTVSGSYYSGYFRPPFLKINGWTGYGDNPVTKDHYDCYETGDLRKNVNIKLYNRSEYTNIPASIIFPCYVNKYQDLSVDASVGSSENNYPIIRYSDILLMRAEALNAINPGDKEAYNLLNTVRRRGFGKDMNETSEIDIPFGLTKDVFLDVILLERRKEFAFEGQRRFDLLRTNKLKEAMMKQNPTIGSVIEEKHYLLPIPITELDANKLMEQNPGW
ncbi:RagB/SusD family nutrient uptake outer membrane protein [Parabacteroides sp. Marseille-P3160]|uniref:RagB/SusD family nutrient uptake outer membrane protein n=1 Tax=Parabacteroides sp. Marseille-P3160 TaxID=1917887 RepID=UPI0009BBC0A7|nr:RagB/SusD family nutrient uptake outer membrane protein [Parabacteroides sp. Marseille-P3160]